MESKDLAPISVEIVKAEDLRRATAFTRIEKDDNSSDLFGMLDSALGAAADVLNLAEEASLYRVEVPDGYTLKDLVPSKKDAEAMRALVKDSNGKLNGDVALKLNGVSPAQIASIGLAAGAMVVGQAYMTEISDSLHSIDSKLDAVTTMIVGERKAKVKNAISIANDYIWLRDDYAAKPRGALQAARTRLSRGTTTSERSSIG